MKHVILCFLLSLAGLFIISCNDCKCDLENQNSNTVDSITTQVMVIGSKYIIAKDPVSGIEKSYLALKDSSMYGWTPLYAEIERFNYEQGYEYKIIVKVIHYKFDPSLVDKLLKAYILQRVLSKTIIE